MLTNVVIFVGILIVAVLVYGAVQPGTFRVERQVRIDAPPDRVDALLVDFHRWNA